MQLSEEAEVILEVRKVIPEENREKRIIVVMPKVDSKLNGFGIVGNCTKKDIKKKGLVDNGR